MAVVSVRTVPKAALTREFRGHGGNCLTLTHYPEGEHQEKHEHDHTQISFLIAGAIQETVGRICHEMKTPAMCIKPAGTDHSNLWGQHGAFMLTIRLKDWDRECAAGLPVAQWIPGSSSPRALIAAAFAAESAAEIDGIIGDLLGGIDVDGEKVGPPPAWLGRVEEALWDGEAVTADEAAGIAGVHRAHLSRAFARFAGIPFSLYRRQIMIGRAIEATLRSSEPLASVAHASGFADQSHMHRAITELAGMTPRRLRTAFVAGTL